MIRQGAPGGILSGPARGSGTVGAVEGLGAGWVQMRQVSLRHAARLQLEQTSQIGTFDELATTGTRCKTRGKR